MLITDYQLHEKRPEDLRWEGVKKSRETDTESEETTERGRRVRN